MTSDSLEYKLKDFLVPTPFVVMRGAFRQLDLIRDEKTGPCIDRKDGDGQFLASSIGIDTDIGIGIGNGICICIALTLTLTFLSLFTDGLGQDL